MTQDSHAEACVDIVLPAFNAEATIDRAAKSVLADPALRRLIIVDDASSDETPARIRMLAEKYPKVIPVLLEENVGPAEARNIGFGHSKADWVGLLDSDDWMDENRLSKMLAEASAANADIVADDVFMHKPDGTSASVWSPDSFSPFLISAAFFAQMNIESVAGTAREFGYIKPLFRRESLHRTAAPWRKSLRIMEDYDLYMRCLVAGDRFLFMPRAGYHYDRGSASRAFRPDNLQEVVRIDRAHARQLKDRQAKYWLGRHADLLEALILWDDAVGKRNLLAVPQLFLRSVTRPAIGKNILERISRKLRGLDLVAPMARDIPKGSPADLGSV